MDNYQSRYGIKQSLRTSKGLYGICTMLSIIKSLRYTMVFRKLGPRIIIMQKLTGDAVQYISLLLLFAAAYGVYMQSVLNPFYPINKYAPPKKNIVRSFLLLDVRHTHPHTHHTRARAHAHLNAAGDSSHLICDFPININSANDVFGAFMRILYKPYFQSYGELMLDDLHDETSCTGTRAKFTDCDSWLDVTIPLVTGIYL